MALKQHSTVIFVQSTAHWEAIQQQKAQLLINTPPPSSPAVEPPRFVERKYKTSSAEPKKDARKLHLIGKEGSRRRQRWTNRTFSEHPSAVLYAEDLPPPGYETTSTKYYDAASLILTNDEEVIIDDLPSPSPSVQNKLLSRHTRHDLKKAHISQGLVTNYESQLLQCIDVWLDEPRSLDNACFQIQVASNNQFERYVLHTMCRYYGLYSLSQADANNNRVTFICHPAYVDYLFNNNQDQEAIDYADIESWEMPDKSFFDYLFDNK